jgi:hypothetical protein
MRVFFLIIFVSGFLTLIKAQAPVNDSLINAYDITQKVIDGDGYYCSAEDTIGISLFTTNDATPDGVRPSCQPSNHPLTENVWFKYQVGSSKSFNLQFILQGVSGSLENPYITIWDDTDTTENISLEELKCKKYFSATNDIHIGAQNLVEGKYYYVSIDGGTVNHSGNFYICASNNVLYPDEPEIAYDITQKVLDGDGYYCSAEDTVGISLFNTDAATPDGVRPSCQPSSHPLTENVWFKYQVGSSKSFNLQFILQGVSGSLENPYITIWDDTDTTENISLEELKCKKYFSATNDIHIGAQNLVEGKYYYVSIDGGTASHSGNFYICASDNVLYPDEPEIAYDITQKIIDGDGYYCSAEDTVGVSLFTTNVATPDGVRPSCQPSNHPLTENIWFKYKVGPSKAFDIHFKIAGVTGRLSYPYVTLWKDSDTTDNLLTLQELKCKKYLTIDNDIHIGSGDLEEGQYYYVSIDGATDSHSGNFYICASDNILYPDEPEIAYDITQKVIDGDGYYCSVEDTVGVSLFTTNVATPDGVRPSCQPSNHPLTENIWFKYQVGPSEAFDIHFKIAGVTGRLSYPYVTLWKDSDTTDNLLTLQEMKCKKYVTIHNDIHIGGGDLEEGQYYYVSIDAALASHSGNFYICASDEAYPDDPDGAFDLTQRLAAGNYCSENESLLFNLEDATDGSANLSCFNSSNAMNEHWFKYQAQGFGTIDFKIRSGSTLGTLTYPYISVWELSEQLTEIDCKKYITSQGDLTISDIEVAQGTWYYFRVDARETHSGTYSVCLETDVVYTPFISNYPDVCFSLGEITCDKLFYDATNSETVVRVPIIYEGEKIPAGFEFCIYTDQEIDNLDSNPILNVSEELYSINFNNEGSSNALCITFHNDFSIQPQSFQLSYKVNLSEIDVNSAIHLQPYSISPPCDIECSECALNEEKLVERRLLFEINPVIIYTSPGIPQPIQYSDGEVTYQISEIFQTEEIETLIVKIENDDGEMISYYPYQNSSLDAIPHTFNSNGAPAKSEYLIEITAQAKSGLNYYLKSKVLLLSIGFEYIGLKTIFLYNEIDNVLCENNSEWISKWNVIQSEYINYNIDLDIYDTHYEKDDLTIQGSGQNSYGDYITNLNLTPQIGHFVISAKAENENIGEILEMRYDYIIECANGTTPP